MKGVTKAMTTMNKQLNLRSLQNILREFEKQSEKMEITQDALDDAVDDALEGENEEEETEKLVNQVCILDTVTAAGALFGRFDGRQWYSARAFWSKHMHKTHSNKLLEAANA